MSDEEDTDKDKKDEEKKDEKPKGSSSTIANIVGQMQAGDQAQQQQFLSLIMQMQQELLGTVGRRIDRVEEDVRGRATRIDDEIRRVEDERRKHTQDVDRNHFAREKELENKIESVEKQVLEDKITTGKDITSLKEKTTTLEAGPDTLVDPATGKPLPYYKQPAFWLLSGQSSSSSWEPLLLRRCN
jgi:hypothetical protein